MTAHRFIPNADGIPRRKDKCETCGVTVIGFEEFGTECRRAPSLEKTPLHGFVVVFVVSIASYAILRRLKGKRWQIAWAIRKADLHELGHRDHRVRASVRHDLGTDALAHWERYAGHPQTPRIWGLDDRGRVERAADVPRETAFHVPRGTRNSVSGGAQA